MAENKKKVIVYADWISKFEALEDAEAGKLIKHFFRYINDLNPEFPDRITEISFIDIKNTLKRDLDKWEKRAENSRENGKSGGRPTTKEQVISKPTETHQVILEPTKPVNGSVSVNDNVNVTVKKEIKPKKILFRQSPYFDKNEFLKEFPGWSKEKLLKYYDAAVAWSDEGNKKVNWIAAIKIWASRDEEKKVATKKDSRIHLDPTKKFTTDWNINK